MYELMSGATSCSTDPVMLQVEVTARCNFACRYCIVHNGTEPRPGGDMTLDTFREILRRFPRAFYVHLHGQGEPLILGDRFIEMARLAAAERRFFSVVTNGSLCTEDMTRALLEAGIGALAVSLDLCSPDRTATERRLKGGQPMDVAEVEANLRRAVALRDRMKRRTSIGVSAVLLADVPNEEVRAALRRLDGLGVDFVMVGPLAGTSPYRGRYPFDLLARVSEDVTWHRGLLGGTRCEIITTPASNSVAGRCVWPWSALYVNYDGSVSSCSNNHRLPAGGRAADRDVRNLALHRALRAEFGAGTVPDGCRGCQYLLGGPGRLTLVGGLATVVAGIGRRARGWRSSGSLSLRPSATR
jgi:MoaA/NifB/PqqE/SkfB family radical SAM enzyme